MVCPYITCCFHRHYQDSLDVIATIVLLQTSPEETKKQQEDADRSMENEHKKNHQGEQETMEKDDSEAGRELPSCPTGIQLMERGRHDVTAASRSRE